MSFREKHLWISIVVTLGVWGGYFWQLFQRVMGGDLGGPDLAEDMGDRSISCLVVSVVVEIILTAIATWTTRKAEREAKDEREILASLKASHVALMALIARRMSAEAWPLGLLAAGGAMTAVRRAAANRFLARAQPNSSISMALNSAAKAR